MSTNLSLKKEQLLKEQLIHMRKHLARDKKLNSHLMNRFHNLFRRAL